MADNHLKAKENLFDELIEEEENTIKKIQNKIDLFDGKKDSWVFTTLVKALATKTELLGQLKCARDDLDYLARMEEKK